jgi:tRNA (Thr-GGU) A37 N-methylase
VAEVIAVEGRTLVLGGADIVDGSPVLDIKPYVAFCDSVAAATAPSWVAAKVRGEWRECARRKGAACPCLPACLPLLPAGLAKHLTVL